MSERGLLDLIITRIPGLSVPERVVLCEKFEKEEEITILTKRDIEKIVNRPMTRQSWLMDDIRFQAEKDAKTGRIRGIAWVSCVQAEYPPLLKEIFDPPAVLFYRGKLPCTERPMAAVVGTRRPAAAAASQAFDLARDLGRAGIAVVSGLALGIDAMAHRGNLEGGAATVAVLGSGADEVYPASNRLLARRILETGGALLSEYPPGTQPRPWRFPARNRIIAALARGTVVVQAPEKSGALITARLALEQGRDLWISPAGLSGPLSGGTAKLAADGAGIVRSVRDILEEWNIETGPSLFEAARIYSGAGGQEPKGKDLALALARSLDIDIKE
jgi:DNA processing protein